MVVFSYASLLPAGLYGFLWWAGQSSSATISFLELVCLYGYSLTIYIPVSGPYLLSLGCSLLSSSGTVVLKRNNKERVIEAGRCDIVDLNEDDCLKVMSEPGTKAKDISLMGLLLRPRVFITPGTTL